MSRLQSPSARKAARTLPGLIGLSAVLALAAPSLAAAAPASTSCRASAARVQLLGLVGAEPVRANANGSPCTTQSAETLHPTAIGPVHADAVAAYTSSRPGFSSALAGVSRPSVALGGVKLEVQAIQASASTTCVAGVPQSSGSSRVVGLTLNGKGIVLPSGDAPSRLALGSGFLAVNQTVRSGTGIQQRAVELNLPGVGDIVLGEAASSRNAEACAGDQGGMGGGGGGTGPGVCPPGSSFDPAQAVCVISQPGTSTVIVVGRPYSGPSGGRVISLTEARKRFSSPCLSGPGRRFVIVGTQHHDAITGTNRADRILALGGKDYVDGGRGNDCLDGGRGNDTLSGALGRDRLYGAAGGDKLYGGDGRDRIFGGPGGDRSLGGSGSDLIAGQGGNDYSDGDRGNDRLTGGAGRDRLHGGVGSDRVDGGDGADRLFGSDGNDVLHGDHGNDVLYSGVGRDRLYGGRGNDFVSAASPGSRARVLDGGSGFDRGRVTRGYRSAVRHVERVLVYGF